MISKQFIIDKKKSVVKHACPVTYVCLLKLSRLLKDKQTTKIVKK